MEEKSTLFEMWRAMTVKENQSIAKLSDCDALNPVPQVSHARVKNVDYTRTIQQSRGAFDVVSVSQSLQYLR